MVACRCPPADRVSGLRGHERQAYARAPEWFVNGSVPDWPPGAVRAGLAIIIERVVGQGTKREPNYLLSNANCLRRATIELNRAGKLLVIILARHLRVRFDKSMVKNDLSKSRVHGVVHGQSYINS
jgi:hypothetical protein